MSDDPKFLVSPEARRALERYTASTDVQTTRKGWQYFKEGRVREHWVDGPSVCGEVRGTKLYMTTLTYEQGKWVGDCDCPVGGGCEHTHALANYWIELIDKARRPGALTPSPKPVAQKVAPASLQDILPFVTRPPLPAAKPSATSPNPATPAPPAQASPAVPPKPAPQAAPPPVRTPAPAAYTDDVTLPFVERQLRRIAQASGRPAEPQVRLWLNNLESLHRQLVRADQGHLYVRAMRKHCLLPRVWGALRDYEMPMRGWWPPSSPPQTPWHLWEYLAYMMLDNGEALPAQIAEATDTKAVRAEVDAFSRSLEVESWRVRLAVPEERKPFSRPECHGLRLRLSRHSWNLQHRSRAEGPWTEPPIEYYEALNDTLHIGDYAHLPLSQRVLASLLLADPTLRYSKEVMARVVTSLMASPDTAACLVGPDGRPFVLEREPLHLLLKKGGAGRVGFVLQDGAGRIALDALRLTEIPFPIYQWDSALYRGPHLVPTETAPEDILAEPRILAGLRKQGAVIHTDLNVRVRTVPLKARLHCRVSKDQWSTRERVVFRIDARNPEGPELFSAVLTQWKWEGGKLPPRKDAAGVMLDYDNVAGIALLGRLPDLDVEVYEEHLGEWYCDLTKAFPEQFVAWRASLDPAVEVLADAQLAGLVGGPMHAAISVSASSQGVGASRDWFDVHIGVQIEKMELTEQELALLLKSRGKWVRLPRLGFQRLELDLGAAQKEVALLDQLGLGVDELLGSSKDSVHKLHALQLAGVSEQFEDKALVEAIRTRVASLHVAQAVLPAGLRAQLRPYQLEGFQFLVHLSENGLGGVLADDMGLGKTVQTLAWLLHCRDVAAAAGKVFRGLIVCPKSVSHGWVSECERFAPDLRISSYKPSQETLGSEAGLVVCNYAQLRLNSELFTKAHWDAVVLDEGQFIKTPTSQVAVTCRALKAGHRLVLTGTPVENRTLDLWSLFAFAQPGLLGTQASFKRQYPQEDKDALARLRRRTRHFMLRRTKAQVATDLPARIEDEIVVDMEDRQLALYNAEFKRAQQELLKVREPGDFDAARFNILASLLRLRQICCHPALLSEEFRSVPSAKLEALVERVEELRDEGHKVLVFSQFTSMLDLIAERLTQESIPSLMLTGRTENRQDLVKQFQEDASVPVFLLSIKAAGFGLNLTAASYVILYDPWWNPAVEAQAIDRAHRIGQTEVVTAYRILAADTVERKIRAMQQEKAALAGSIVQEESLASVLDLESLRQILA